MFQKIIRKTRKAFREGGPLLILIRLLQKIHFKLYKNKIDGTSNLISLVKKDDLLSVDWIKNPYTPVKVAATESYRTAWVMSPPGKGSGGHLSIFRFLQVLEAAGHTVDIYLYTNILKGSLDDYESVIRRHFPQVAARIHILNSDAMATAYDAVFATGWETAYPVFKFSKASKKFYFVQDFEPMFYATGTDSILAENTYKFGFYGITAGGWLTNKLKRDYGMEADYFTFGVDHDIYTHRNHDKRTDVFFYARPVTARRAFELGIFALEEFAKRNPEVTIHLAGWDLSTYRIPFKHISYGVVTPQELADIYNRCAAGLVLSLTNMSLLPPELLACGAIPVINSGENNSLVYDNPNYEWTETSPSQIADAIERVVNNPQQLQRARAAANSVKGVNWNDSGKRFLEVFEKHMKS